MMQKHQQHNSSCKKILLAQKYIQKYKLPEVDGD